MVAAINIYICDRGGRRLSSTPAHFEAPDALGSGERGGRILMPAEFQFRALHSSQSVLCGFPFAFHTSPTRRHELFASIYKSAHLTALAHYSIYQVPHPDPSARGGHLPSYTAQFEETVVMATQRTFKPLKPGP